MFRKLLYPFLVYRSFFFPFFVLSLIVVPCWLVFRLYRLRTRGQPLSLRRETLLLTVVLYLCGVASATLAPNHGSRARADATVGIELHPSLASLTCSSATLPQGSNARFFCLYNAKGNVLLFVPLGILLPLVWRRLRYSRAILIAIAVSVSIELLQYLSRAWGSYRLADVNDVLLNVLGACIGLAFVFLLRLPRYASRGSALET
jgi:glycopeptide antibiotics resistance protein